MKWWGLLMKIESENWVEIMGGVLGLLLMGWMGGHKGSMMVDIYIDRYVFRYVDIYLDE